MVKLVNVTTGLGVDLEGLRDIAKRLVELTRRFNLREGLSREDDSLPRRFFDEPLENGDVLPKENFERLVADYYRLRGWE